MKKQKNKNTEERGRVPSHPAIHNSAPHAKQKANGEVKNKSLESWIWDAACSIRGAKDAPKYKDYILPLIFTKRLCDVFDDELNRIAAKVGSRKKAFQLVRADHKLVRFYLPLVPDNPDEPVWSVIRKLADKIGEGVTSHMRAIAKDNPALQGIIDRVDFNATTHGQRDIDDDRLSNLIEAISTKRLGLDDVEADIIGKSYEYLIRKFAEGSGQSAGEFYTPGEVSEMIAYVLVPEPGMEIYDPTCGSGGLLIKCELAMETKMKAAGQEKFAPLKLFGQEFTPETWAMANMNMIIHDMEGEIELGDTFKNPKFHNRGKLRTFDRVIANPMWNQKDFSQKDYTDDEYGRFDHIGYPGIRADWGWVQHILASLKATGRAAVILGTGSASRGSGGDRDALERIVREKFIDLDLLEVVVLLPENLFYNTQNAGVIYFLNRRKLHPREVLMVDLTEQYHRGRAKNTLSDDAGKLLKKSYDEWLSIPGISEVVACNDIKNPDNDYNLLPNRYIRLAAPKNWENQVFRDFKSTKNNFTKHLAFNFLGKFFQKEKLVSNAETEVALAQHSTSWRLVPLGTLLTRSTQTHGIQDCKLTPLSLTKDEGIIAQSDRFGHAVALEDLSSYLVIKQGWLAYNPMVIWEGAIHVLYEPHEGVLSPAYEVWVPNPTVDPRYLDYILKTPEIMDEYRRLSSGGVKRRRIVSTTDFMRIKVPFPSPTLMLQITSSLDKLTDRFDVAVDDLIAATLKQLT